MRYFFLALLALSVSFSSYAIAPITGVTKVCQNSTTQLYDVTPGGSWSSSAPLIANVNPSSGLVSGVYPGTAIITYTSGTARATAIVTVNATAGITGTTTLCATATTTLSNPIFGGSWSTKDPAIATVTPGISNVTVTGVSAGTDSVFYTYPSGCKVSTIITVNPSADPIKGSSTVCLGNTTILSDVTLNGVWSSSVPAIAGIGLATGIVTGLAPGPVTITYTPLSGCYRTMSFTVNALPAGITGTTHVHAPFSTTLTDATPGGLWSSSNTTLAVVGATSGVVTGKAQGTLNIFYTVTSTGCRTLTHFTVNPFPDSASIFPVMGWYPACADLKDHSTQSHDLTLPPNPSPPTPPTFTLPTYGPDRFGIPNNAYVFDGQKNALQYSPAYSTTTPSGDFTVSCWAKASTAVATIAQNSYVVYDGVPALNGFGFLISDGVTFATPGNYISVYFGGVGNYLPTAIPDGGWHMYTLMKKSNSYSFFVDKAFSGTFTKPMNPPTSKFNIGNDATFAGKAFIGYIDDIAFFNRALSDTQMASLYTFSPGTVPFSLGNDTTICGDSITLQPKPMPVGRLFSWSTVDSVSSKIVVNPPPLATTPYSLTVTEPYGCTVTDIINITKSPLILTLGNDTNICAGDTIILDASYSGAKYKWNTGDTTAKVKASSTGYYIVTIDSTGCLGHDTLFLNARRTPIVDLGPDMFNCKGAPVTIKNFYQAYDTGFVYLWSNGSNLDSLVANTSGSFWVQVSNNGCLRSDSIDVLIVYDTFSFNSRDTAICKGRTVVGQATANPIVHYQWTPTTGIPLSTEASTNITPDTSATYVLTGTFPGCADQVFSFHIDVQPYPIVNMGGNRHVCQFDTVNITAGVIPNWYDKYIFDWSPGTFLDDSTRQTIIFTAGDTTKLFIKVSTPAGCSGTDSALILVHPGNFDSLFSDIRVCPGDTVRLKPTMYYADSNVVATYEWHPGRYLDDSTSSSPMMRAITSEAFTTIGTSQYGCKDTFHFHVIVNPAAVMYLGDSATLYPGETYQINPQTNCTYFHWFPHGGLSDTVISNPLANPSVETKYIVHASTAEGCSIIDSINIRVDPSTIIAMPNAFTPGAGVNDKFYILKRGIATIDHFTIYDRWGVKVFETKDITEGWDGTYKDTPQPFAVYVYDVEGTTNTGKKFHKTGNVTLIR